MNWQNVVRAVLAISKGTPDLAPSVASLRTELADGAELSAADHAEVTRVLNALSSANLYGRIALIGQLKETLSKYPQFKAHFAEYGLPR